MRSTVWVLDPKLGRPDGEALASSLAALGVTADARELETGTAVVVEDAPTDLAPPATVVRTSRIDTGRRGALAPRPLFRDLGRLGVFVFGVLVATGATLAFWYRPSSDGAFASLVDANGSGVVWFLRALHRVAGHVLVAIVAAYVLRGYFRRLFLGPRGPATWRIAVAFGFVCLGFLLTGAALPWNQSAYGHMVGAADALARIPLVGPALAEFVRGGVGVSGLTVVRVYAIHVLVLPWLAFWLLVLGRDLRRKGERR
jgi:hypothetical protein